MPLKSEGLLETPITWEILERDFQKRFDSTSEIGENRSVKVIGGGMGYISKLLLVTFDWTGDQAKLPSNAVIKITIDLPYDEPPKTEWTLNDPIILTERMVHDSELLFYESSLDPKKVPPELKVPQFYCGRRYGQDGIDCGYIAMEFIDGTVNRHIYHNIDKNGVQEAVDELAKLAVFSMKNQESLSIWPDNRYSIMSNVLAYCKFYEPNLVTRLQRIPEKFPELTNEVEKMIGYVPKYFEDYQQFQSLRKSTSRFFTLCQGDIWSPNVLWSLDENGGYHVKGFVDWQTVQVGSPLEDLVFLLHSTLSSEDYRKEINNILEHYYLKLQESLDSELLPWKNLNELIDKYELTYAYMIPILLPLTVSMVNFESCSAEVIEECKNTWSEKIVLMAREAVHCLDKHLQK